jgi:DNA-binding beta-propeller fold protein YncE
MKLWLVLSSVLFLAAPAHAQNCNQPASQPISEVALPDHPFSAIPTSDGCTIFVSLTGEGGSSHIAVLKRTDGVVSVAHVAAAKGGLTGMALSHDGSILLAANGAGVTLFDTARLIAGSDDAALGYLNDDAHAGSIYVAISPDGHFFVVSDERSNTLSLYDFAALLAGKSSKMIGRIHTGNAPVGLAFSPDGRLLYSTSESLPGGSPTCTGEGASHPQGLLMVVDMMRIAADPDGAVLARVAAGCNPVRVALSASGDRAYVTARGDDALIVFDTGKLVGDSAHALNATIKVGRSPVGVAVAGNSIFVTNSDRFGGGQNQSVSAIDANNLSAAQGSIPAGGFPRELQLTADGNTLLITNFDTDTLELVDLARLSVVAK